MCRVTDYFTDSKRTRQSPCRDATKQLFGVHFRIKSATFEVSLSLFGHVPVVLMQFFSSDGYLPGSVAELTREATSELQELRVHLYSRWNFAWAVKKV